MEEAQKNHKNQKRSKFDDQVPDSIKEKSYVTRQVDTSISILDSPENEVVLESLLFLSKYADFKLSNLTYLQQKGISSKILNLLDKNICILRLSLRLLAVLLDKTQIICEIDQDKYDSKILEISNLYTTHNDRHVREFCLDILSKLSKSCRITCLIFKTDLLIHILETIKQTKTSDLLVPTLQFLNHLLDSPAAQGNLTEAASFDVNVFVQHLTHEDTAIAKESINILVKLTSRNIRAFQKIFRDAHLVEQLFDLIMDPNKKQFHEEAFIIIKHCLNSEETNSNFVRSIQFLSFCQWTARCEPAFVLLNAEIFEKLSSIPSMIQMLYDLSVEEFILLQLNTKDKVVLNTASKAISNMSVHRYCLEDMLTPTVVKTLVESLNRTNDVVDPANEVVLETIYTLFKRSSKAITMLYQNKIIPILLRYFTEVENISEANHRRVTDMLYRYANINEYQQSVLGEIFLEKLLKIVENDCDESAKLAIEILVNFVGDKNLVQLMLSNERTKMFLEKLMRTSNKELMKFLLLFIHSAMFFDELSLSFLKGGLLSVLKSLSEHFVEISTVVTTIRNLAYSVHLPTKFYETGKIDLTTKLGDRFYVLNGRINERLPFIEILEAKGLCPFKTIYVLEYDLHGRRGSVDRSIATESKIQSQRTSSDTLSKRKSKTKRKTTPQADEMICMPNYNSHYGFLSPDPYLPMYVRQVLNSLSEEWGLEQKIAWLAEFIDQKLCGPVEDETMPGKIHEFKLHLECLKMKLGTSIIPIGFLRIGFHCERALLFKALADKINIPCTLQKNNKVFWNEVALLEITEKGSVLTFYVVDLMNDIGTLLTVGSKEANKYLRNTVQ